MNHTPKVPSAPLRLLGAISIALVMESVSAQNQLPNLNSTPTANRFTVTDRVWPANPGEASICVWADDKLAALTICIDDNNAGDVAWWRQQADIHNIPLTWFLITNRVDNAAYPSGGTWNLWREVVADGHSVQSHTHTHLAGLPPDWLGIAWDYSTSISQIDANIAAPHRCLTLSYPGGVGAPPNDRTTAAAHFAAARGVTGGINSANKIDYLNIKSNSSVVVNNPATPSSSLNSLFNSADLRYYRGWAVQNFGHPANLATTLQPLFDFAAANAANLWVGTFDDVSLYGQERDTATLTPGENTAQKITFGLSDLMLDSRFDVPLTVKVRIPNDWGTFEAKQGGQPVAAETVLYLGNKYALVKAVPDRGQVELSNELPAVAQAEAKAQTIRQAFAAAMWPGYQGQTLVDYDVATSSAHLNTLLTNLPNAQPGVWHRIRLSGTGNWSNGSAKIINFRGSPSSNTQATTGAGGNRDYSVGGGGVLLEPESGTVNIESQFSVSGVRGLHVRNLTFARTARVYAAIAPGGTYAMPLEHWSPGDTPANWTPRDEPCVLITRTTSIDMNIRNPELPIVILENCKIGTGFHPTDGNNSLAYCTGIRITGGSDQISILNCQINGVQTGITSSSIRWFKLHRNDFQRLIGDATITLNTAGDAGYAQFGMVYPDRVSNIWRRLNTVRNVVDECDKKNAQNEDVGFWAEHTDAWQLGTGGDTGGYNALSEYNVTYMERASYYDVDDTGTGFKRETGGTQGSYNDDSHFAIDIVTINEINANNTGNCFVNWNGANSYLVKSIGARVGSLAPSAKLGVNATFNFSIDPIVYASSSKYSGFTPASTLTVTGSVYEMLRGSGGGTIVDGGNNTQARFRKNLSPSAASALNGPFTTDAEGRTAYTFPDTGAEAVPDFRRALWLQLKPKVGGGGPEDPATWPAY